MGTMHDKQGLFQAAEGGTLLLDEVADLPLATQVKLLRVLQEKAVRPVGSETEVSIDVRLISATHKRLNQEVAAGRFRDDRFYRINVIDIAVPALRDRREDIPDLALHLLAKIAEENGGTPKTLAANALALLCSADFPGNVRQLENILARAAALTDAEEIQADDLDIITSASTVRPTPVQKTSASTDLGHAVTPSGGRDRTTLDAVAGDL